ncbi:MAG: hypothetical protein PHF31_14265 [Methylobacter sp.]|nr:hypothetical protein [Methylobacter sp.]
MKSYTIGTQGLGAGVTVYAAGFYEAPLASAALTQAAATVNYGAANRATAAHAFLVASGAGSVNAGSCSIVVSGTSFMGDGTRVPGDSEVIVADITAMSANQYFETSKKWLGQVTFTLTPSGAATYSATFNYGFTKYDDFGNVNFTVNQVEAVGLAGANDADFDVQLIHHNSAGWTYSAAAFVPGPAPVLSLVTDYATDDEIDNGYGFAWKRRDLSIDVEGSMSEGVILRMVTTANNAVQFCNMHIGVSYR